MYVPGTTTPKTTWVDQAQMTANVNPIILDSSGRAIIYGVGQYRQIVTDSHGNTVWDQLTSGTPGISGYVDARDFGLRQGGTVTDAQAIQLAINYASSIGGATVYLGPGPISFTSTDQLIWPANGNAVSLKGDGPQATLITISGVLTQDVCVLTAGNLAHCQIRDLGFQVNDTATGGALIHFANCYAAHVENVRMADAFYNGVAIGGGPNQYLCTIRDLICPAAPTANACIIIGDDSTTLAQGIYIDTCKLAASQFGIYIRNGSGVEVSNTECLSHVSSGLITSPGTGEQAKSVQCVGLLCDSCGLAAINLGHAGGNTSFVSLANCWAASSQVGVLIGPNPNVNNISLDGCQIHVNQTNGIDNKGANAVLINSCLLAGNGTLAANTYDAILIESGIQNNVIGNFIGAAFGFPAMQRYAISIIDAVDYTNVALNVTGGGGTGSINNGSSGTHNNVTLNTGT